MLLTDTWKNAFYFSIFRKSCNLIRHFVLHFFRFDRKLMKLKIGIKNDKFITIVNHSVSLKLNFVSYVRFIHISMKIVWLTSLQIPQFPLKLVISQLSPIWLFQSSNDTQFSIWSTLLCAQKIRPMYIIIWLEPTLLNKEKLWRDIFTNNLKINFNWKCEKCYLRIFNAEWNEHRRDIDNSY